MAKDRILSRRERKKLETRRRLLEAAMCLFQEYGYDDTTVEQISEAADVAKSTFFNYFEAKEAILPALVAWRLRQLQDALSPERGAPASPIARIKFALHLMAEDPLLDPLLIKQLFSAAMHRRLHQGTHPAHALAHLLAEQVCQAQAVGEIRADLDPFYLGCVIRVLFFQQIMMWHHECRPACLSETLDGMVDLLLLGIAGPKWRKLE